MTLTETMQSLEKSGKSEIRRTYQNQGAGDQVFGVRTNDLLKLQKKILRDHALAIELWTTKNEDARILATMIGDPAQMTEAKLESWAGDIHFKVVADNFTQNLVCKTPFAKTLMLRWMASKAEFIKRCGYTLLAEMAGQEDSLTDQEFFDNLWQIVKDIHEAPNRAKEAMHLAVIAIGMRSKKLNKEALFASMQIGPILIDHGQDTEGLDLDALRILTDKKLQKRLKENP